MGRKQEKKHRIKNGGGIYERILLRGFSLLFFVSPFSGAENETRKRRGQTVSKEVGKTDNRRKQRETTERKRD